MDAPEPTIIYIGNSVGLLVSETWESAPSEPGCKLLLRVAGQDVVPAFEALWSITWGSLYVGVDLADLVALGARGEILVVPGITQGDAWSCQCVSACVAVVQLFGEGDRPDKIDGLAVADQALREIAHSARYLLTAANGLATRAVVIQFQGGRE